MLVKWALDHRQIYVRRFSIKRMYASVNKAIIAAYNGLVFVQCQAITLANAGLSLIGPVESILS